MGVGEVHFRSKKLCCNFFCFRKGNIGHEFPEKASKRGGVISDLKNFVANFSASATGLRKNCNIFFRKRGGGGGQRPFGNFPEIHRYLKRRASLISLLSPSSCYHPVHHLLVNNLLLFPKIDFRGSRGLPVDSLPG